MGIIKKYECCLREDIEWSEQMNIRNVEWRVVKGIDHGDAAEEYAKWAYSARDMWDISGVWEDDATVIVVDLNGKQSEFNIKVENEPTFNATKIEKKEQSTDESCLVNSL